MLKMDPTAPKDAFPSGFKGFVSNTTFGTSNILGQVTYKTQYFNAGDILYYQADGTPVESSGDKVKRVCLGLSTQTGFGFDTDLLSFKGNTALDTSLQTHGFHISTNASSITGTT
jgi:hypothetical protein